MSKNDIALKLDERDYAIMRREALDHAVRVCMHPVNSKAIVANAKTFYTFLKGR